MSPTIWIRTTTGTLVLASIVAACAVGTANSGDTTGLDPSPDDAQAGVDSGRHSDASTPRESSANSTPDTSMPIDPNTAADAGADTNQDLPETGSPDTNLPDANLPDTNAIDTGSTCAAHGYTGVLVSFDLSSQTGSEASVPATPVAPGVTGVALTRSAAILPVSGSGSINGSNWAPGSSADATRYYTFGINAGAGCTVTLTGLTIDTVASTQGPKTVDVATNADAFATHTAASAATSASTKTLAATASSPIEVRVYGYAAGATAGTLRIQNMMTLSGTLN